MLLPEATQCSNQYTKKISTFNPTLIFILEDKSTSMRDEWESQSKAHTSSKIVNQLLHELIKLNSSGESIRDRCFVAIIGYGTNVEPILFGKLSEIADSFQNTFSIVHYEKDATGNSVATEMTIPQWVEPTTAGSTPMAEAFEKSYEVISNWLSAINPLTNHPYQESFPPIVINITDGVPNDLQQGGNGVQTTMAANKLMNLSSDNGNLLLYNFHIGSSGGNELQFPNDVLQLTNKYAQFLYNISSTIPIPLIKDAELSGFYPKPNARGLIYNGRAETLIQMLNFGTSGLR